MRYTEEYKHAYADMLSQIIWILHDLTDGESEAPPKNVRALARADVTHDILVKAYGLLGENAVRERI